MAVKKDDRYIRPIIVYS